MAVKKENLRQLMPIVTSVDSLEHILNLINENNLMLLQVNLAGVAKLL